MDKDSKEIVPRKISKPLINIIDPNIKKHDHKLMVFWIIIGVLSLILLYYAYEMLFIYF
ncbi:MAG: hypothetical protein N2B06_03835 [Clostridium sp.]|jgi:hypothetical protein